ncbi:MAG TPA: tyrosine--tRNA ligase [Anaerolineaceae bacterium]
MNIEEQVTLLMQGTAYGDESLRNTMEAELRARLAQAEKEGRPLRVYCGYDPRRADLHLGHTVTMRKLRQFQDLGHEVTFLIGTYTSLIGDPSDQDKLRPQLTTEEVEANARTYAEQAFHILDRERTSIRYNAEWLSNLTFADLIRLAANFSIQQFLTREAFRQRWDQGDALYLHEMFYSLMQGYDAHALRADVQVGGTDQLFNIVTAARKIMTYLGDQPNIAIIMGILPGTDGVVKMSKSLGNHIPINTTPEDMYGKVMSVPDPAMPLFARLVTRWTPDQISRQENAVASGTMHPRDAKMTLAREITGCFYGDDAAEKAQEVFAQTFQRHEIPDAMPEFSLLPGQTVLDVLVSSQLAASRSEGRRLMEQKGVRLDGEVLADAAAAFPHPGVLQVGRRHFLHVK